MSTNWHELRNKSHVSHLTIPEVFTEEECDRIIPSLSKYPTTSGVIRTGIGYSVVEEFRKLQTSYIPPSDETRWIYERMDVVFFGAAEYFGLEVRETREDLKFLIYGSGDHFSKWHSDTGDDHANLRKLSMSIELNKTSEYDGGCLEIFPHEVADIYGADRKRGTAIVFPSYRHHRVTPVTRGTRFSLVNWISGPPIR